MKRFRPTMTLLTFAAVAVLTAATPAAAADTRVAEAGYDPAVAAALERVFDDTYTPADLTLIKSHPEVAAYVPDPTRRPESSLRSGGPGPNRSVSDSAQDATTLAETCTWWEHEITTFSVLGFVIYKWVHHVDVCYDGVVVTRFTQRYDFFRAIDAVHYPGTLLVNTASATPAGTAYSHMQRQVQACVLYYGCIGSEYPWSKININGNGTAWANWGIT